MSLSSGPIGIFDSGYGGLTILKAIRSRLPHFDYIYLGDNARAPYGSRSFDVIYDFTLEAVKKLFSLGCPLVILACNTASAKALRSIQQNDLPVMDPSRRVLGVIRPTVEALGDITSSRHVGILGTPGTVSSRSYSMEIAKTYPDIVVTELPCPMWVPLIENNEAASDGADWFVRKYLTQLREADPDIDTIVLACTHYPILLPKIRKYVDPEVNVVAQGELVGESLQDYLLRHPEIASRCTRSGQCCFLTSENTDKFDRLASLFLSDNVRSNRITL